MMMGDGGWVYIMGDWVYISRECFWVGWVYIMGDGGFGVIYVDFYAYRWRSSGKKQLLFPIRQKKKEEKKKSWKIMKSLEGLGEIVGWEFYVYFELKSPSKSIANKNPSKSVDFWIPVDILKVMRNLNWIPKDFVALKTNLNCFNWISQYSF